MLMTTATDIAWMQQALELAKQGEFTARPNPCVGAIIVKDECCVGQGFHWQAGLAHAEVCALKQAGQAAQGATCYVTLEPCSHQGRTGACVPQLIQAGISKVIYAVSDPNPHVFGQGIQQLIAAGITVVQCPIAEAITINQGFFTRMQQKRPYVRAKVGMSLDGKIAMKSGESQWITNPPAREDAHYWRARSGAIVTTVQTVQRDNCRLNVRVPLPVFPENVFFNPPLRVVLDQHLSMRSSAALLQEPGDILIAIGPKVSVSAQQEFLRQVNNPLLHLQTFVLVDEHLNMEAILQALALQEINDVWIEAGATFLGAMVKAQQIDEWVVYIAPKILGHEAVSMAKISGLEALSQHIAGKFTDFKRVGDDLCLRYVLHPKERVEHEF